MSAAADALFRHSRFFFAALILGAAPVLAVDSLGGRILGHFTLYAVAQSAALACLLTILISRLRSRVLPAAILTLYGLAAIIDTAHTAMLSRPLDAVSLSLMLDTNPSEAGGFLARYITLPVVGRTLLVLAVLAAAILFADVVFRRLAAVPRLRVPLLVAVLALAVPGIAGMVKCLSVLGISSPDRFVIWCSLDNGNPTLSNTNRLDHSDIVTKAAWLAKNIAIDHASLKRWCAGLRDLAATDVHASAAVRPDIVVVIGESFIKSHSSLYGYGLPTNPRLAREAEAGRLTPYTDVISTANFTIPSLRNLLNLNDLSAGEQWDTSAFWPLVLARSGYSVFLYDNQYAPTAATTGLEGLLYAPELLEHCYTATADTVMGFDLDFLARVEPRITPAVGAPRLTLWHLQGQHFSAADRYPHRAPFMPFSAADITSDAPWLNAERREEVAHYDNATAYNDSVLERIIAPLRDARPTLLVYFSDHGEESWDSAPYGSRNAQFPDDAAWLRRQFDIPFVIWHNDSLAAACPDLVDRIEASAARSFMLDNLGQLVLGVAGISDPRFYRPGRDLLSPAYTPAARVTSAGYRYDAVTGR